MTRQRDGTEATSEAGARPAGREVAVYLAGVGAVGSALLRQIGERGSAPCEPAPRVVVAGLADSTRAAVRPDGVDPDGWRDALGTGETDLAGLAEAACRDRRPAVFVDCTAAEGPVDHYARLLRRGVSVVCANKIGLSGDGTLYRELRREAGEGAGLYYETTVGAGLPVIRTLQDLSATGDRVERIEGVLSGTLASIFDAVTEGSPFSEAVRRAHEQGYTEPDPREDLSGRDVARKALILGREIGLDLEPADVSVEGLLPDDGWEDLSLDAFWGRLPEADARFDRARREALREGRRLRYLARVERATGAAGDDTGGRDGDGSASGTRVTVGTERVGPTHPAWSLSGTDNLVAVTSRRYSPDPLVVRGPGAGPDVTAAGVLADVLRAAAERGRTPAASPGREEERAEPNPTSGGPRRA